MKKKIPGIKKGEKYQSKLNRNLNSVQSDTSHSNMASFLLLFVVRKSVIHDDEIF